MFDERQKMVQHFEDVVMVVEQQVASDDLFPFQLKLKYLFSYMNIKQHVLSELNKQETRIAVSKKKLFTCIRIVY